MLSLYFLQICCQKIIKSFIKKQNGDDMIEQAETLNSQAISLASHGEFNDAIACFKRALVVEKKNHLLWYNLGVTYRDSGNLAKAKEALLKAYEISDKDQEVLETLAITCFNMGDLMEAETYCALGMQLNPLNSHLWNTMGVLYFNKEIYSEATECFERAVTINPYYYDALYNLRDTYSETGNKVGYADCVRRMHSLEKSNRGINEL